MKPTPTQARLHQLFYCVNGKLIRKIVEPQMPGTYVGQTAGNLTKSRGRHRVSIDGGRYYTYRIVWKYYYGTDPVNQIDHIDHNPLNDNIWNLRDVTHKQNHANRRVTHEEHSGQVQFETVDGVRQPTPYGKHMNKIRMRARRARPV